MTRKDTVAALIADPEYTPMGIKDMMAVLSIPKDAKSELQEILSALEAEGKIFKNSKKKYQTIEKAGLIKGVFSSKAKGYGFLLSENGEKYFVSPSMTFSAFNEDTVLAQETLHSNDSSKCSECKIVRILKHGSSTVVGTFSKTRNFGFVIPNGQSFAYDIYIPKSKCGKAQNGQTVVATITKWPEENKKPEGCITEILGYPGEDGVDIQSIVRQHGFSQTFPEKVMLSALAAGDCVSETELTERDDFRDLTVFTIDGDDSKDFDDAVSLTKANDCFELGVHIADVSYYVTENSALDIEAKKRGTSVYLPGVVIPMLPQKLSNGICSLNPDTDRLTLSVIMRYDVNGKLQSHKICESVIHSKYRMTYNEVTLALENDAGMLKKYNKVIPVLQDMKTLSQILKKNRMEHGSIDFDFPETKIVLDAHGKAVDVYSHKSTISQGIIEEFMLAANTCVAEEMFWSEIPFIYRVHEKPSAEKITAFNGFLKNMGYSIKGNRDAPHSGAFAALLEKIKDTDKELLIGKVMLRSLMKARYSEECIGHFGLCFQYYCHFTSPIRRYPDLVIHRIIKEFSKTGLPEKRRRYLSAFVADAAKSSSEAEIKAMEAEREGDDMKKAEFMSKKIGEKYSAVISSVASFGIFAQTDFGVEGLISMTDLKDDYYIFDDINLRLIGEHTKKEYKIGDRVNIIVKRADTALREIDYELEDGE